MDIKKYGLLGLLLAVIVAYDIHKVKSRPCSPELEELINKKP